MDKYIKNNLEPEERLLHATSPHWVVFIPYVGMIIVSVVIATGMLLPEPFPYRYLSAVLTVGALLGLAKAALYYVSTELGVTNKRVIGKVGVIYRQTFEIDLEKIESVVVDQSIPGRVLDYGTVVIRGLAGTPIPIHTVRSPIAFRNARMEARRRKEA